MKAIIIAEAASNHNGEISLAKEMIHAAKDAGADMIKFQSYLGSNVRDGHPDKERFMRMNLSDETHFDLMQECEKAGIEFFTTCFDIKRIEFLKELSLKYVKVPSYDLASRVMISELADHFNHLILSTGSATDEDIIKTINLLKNDKKCGFTLLHCITLYPTPPERAKLARMDWLKTLTPLVGFSDHTLGVEVPKAAIAMGATMIEKHFTLDRKMEGKSHSLACDPAELKQIVEYASLFEKVYGDGSDNFGKDEIETRDFYCGLLGEGI